MLRAVRYPRVTESTWWQVICKTHNQPVPAQRRFPNSVHLLMSVERPVSGPGRVPGNGLIWVDSCLTAFGKLKGDSCPSIALRLDGSRRPSCCRSMVSPRSPKPDGQLSSSRRIASPISNALAWSLALTRTSSYASCNRCNLLLPASFPDMHKGMPFDAHWLPFVGHGIDKFGQALRFGGNIEGEESHRHECCNKIERFLNERHLSQIDQVHAQKTRHQSTNQPKKVTTVSRTTVFACFRNPSLSR